MGNIRLLVFFPVGMREGHGDASTLLRVIKLRAGAVFLYFSLLERQNEKDRPVRRAALSGCDPEVFIRPRENHTASELTHGGKWTFFLEPDYSIKKKKKKAYTATNIFPPTIS